MTTYYNTNGYNGPQEPVNNKVVSVVLPTDRAPGQIPNTTGDNHVIWTSVPVVTGITYPRVSVGNSNASATVDWGASPRQDIILTASCTITFIPPTPGMSVQLKITQDSAGGHQITWPSNIKWSLGVNTVTLRAAATDIATFTYDGTFYWGVLAPDFS